MPNLYYLSISAISHNLGSNKVNTVRDLRKACWFNLNVGLGKNTIRKEGNIINQLHALLFLSDIEHIFVESDAETAEQSCDARLLAKMENKGKSSAFCNERIIEKSAAGKE